MNIRLRFWDVPLETSETYDDILHFAKPQSCAVLKRTCINLYHLL